MATRFTKDKARTEPARDKDIPALTGTVRERTEGHGEGGRFAAGNRCANGRGWKAAISKTLGGDGADVPELVKQARALYLAILRSLPADSPTIRALVAAQARHTALGAHYANEAARAGVATEQGLTLADAARRHDLAAERFATSVLDKATREANRQQPSARRPSWEVDADG